MSFGRLRLIASLGVALVAFSVTLVASGAPTAPSVVQISASGDHTCAVMSGGGVKCWGSNWYGQLGDGVRTNCDSRRPCVRRASGIPVDVIGLGSGVAAVAAGGYHTCALTARGGVKCWGYNASGQLGNGARTCPTQASGCVITRSSRPVDVIGLARGVRAIAAGGFYTCALMTTGGVKCWGANDGGQLGRSGDESSRPVDVAGVSGVSAIAAGGRYSCAVTTGGGATCWGYRPAVISGLGSGVTSVSVGGSATVGTDNHSCALTSQGGVKCWGSNSYGQLGNGSQTDSLTPVDVRDLTSGVKTVAAGGRFTCALTNGGGVKCWGTNSSGELGNGSRTDSRTPVDVVGLRRGVSAITAGTLSVCARKTQGKAVCWGSNYRGTLGTGTAIKLSSKPVDVVFTRVDREATGLTLAGGADGGGLRRRIGIRCRAPARPPARQVQRARSIGLRVYQERRSRPAPPTDVACQHGGYAVRRSGWTQNGDRHRADVTAVQATPARWSERAGRGCSPTARRGAAAASAVRRRSPV